MSNRRLFRRTGIACVLALPVFTVGVAQAKADTIEVDGKAVAIERFGDASRTVPAVVLVHGSDGAGERYRVASRKLAAAGFNVFLVHYLDMTGRRRAGSRALILNIPAWTKAVRGAIDHAAGRGGATGKPVGVMGVSGGSFRAAGSACWRRRQLFWLCTGRDGHQADAADTDPAWGPGQNRPCWERAGSSTNRAGAGGAQ